MKVRSKYLVLALVLVFGLLLVACQPAAEEEATEEPATEEPMEEEPMEEEPAEEEPAEEEPAEVEPVATIRIWADDTRSVILSDLAEDFLAEYQVELVVEEVSDIRDQFATAAPEGQGPDIILGAHDWLGQLVASGLLLPLDMGDKMDSFTDVAIDGCTFEGELYCMPYATENLGFFYNTELVETPPATWEELAEISAQLVEDGEVTYGMALSGTTYDAFPIQTAFGGYIFGQDDAGNYDPNDVGVGSDGMIASAKYIQAGIEAGWLADTVDWDTAHALFETGETAFIMAGPWTIGNERIATSGVPYAITTFPAGPAGEGRPFAGVQGFMINAFSENPLLAQAFLTEFVATDAVMQQLRDVGARPSAWVPVAEADSDADIAAFGEAGANAVLMPAIPEMGNVWSSWGDAFSLIIQNGDNPADTLRVANAQINSVIGGAFVGMVNVPGSWQDNAGLDCGEWLPDCEASALTLDEETGLYTGTFTIEEGDYEVKVALDGGWTVNYGVDGAFDGENYAFTSTGGDVTFTYDPATNLLTIEAE